MKKEIGWITSLRAFAAIAIVLLHTIGGWKGNNWGGDIDARLVLDEVVIQMGYYLASHSNEISNRLAAAFLIIGILGFTVMLILLIFGYNVSYNPDNIFVAMYSMAIFVIVSKSEAISSMSNWFIIKDISKYSFGIYIIHPVILNILNKGLNLFPDIMPIFIGEIVFCFTAFIGAYVITRIICINGIARMAIVGGNINAA